jgi:hypothetical protein
MPSRLSSLLVRDGLVGVKRMEKAFQRQVIYGGSLDTILLEMGLVPDERLTQYLSLGSGLPPASRAECHVFDAAAVERCPEDLAHRHRVVPLALEADALRVLVCEPVDMPGLEALADAIDLPIQPLIVPEYRWHVVYARAYGSHAPARFLTLARQIDAAPVIAPVGRARSVIVEDAADGEDRTVVDIRDVPATPERLGEAAPLGPIGPEQATLRFAGASPARPPAARSPESEPGAARDGADRRVEAERRRAAAPTSEPARPGGAGLSLPAMAGPVPEPVSEATPPPPRITAPPGPPAIATSGELAVPVVPAGAPGQDTPADAVIRAPLTTGATPEADPRAPMSPADAREALWTADNRDRIFLVLLRALRSRAPYAGLLTVQGGAIIGRLAIAEAPLDVAAIGSVLIPLDQQSAFRHAVLSQRPHVGPIATDDPDVDAMIARMGGVVPPAALLLPIVLRDRVVALAIAHRLARPIGLAEVVELLPLAGVAADAIGRLIVRHKAAGYRAPGQPAAGDALAGADVPAKRPESPRPASVWRIPTAQPDLAAGLPRGARAITAEPARTPAELLDEIEAADEGAAEAPIAEAIERAGEVVPLLADRFPGRLRVDRYRVSGRALRPAQYGPLLDLTVRLGPPVTELLLDKLADPSRDVRFYAAVCAAELRPRSAVYALVERVFDADYGVRACAIEALVGYPLRDLDGALARARHALHSDDPERVLAAAGALAALGDVQAIPDLLEVLGPGGRRAEHARRALTSLTRQDFGTSERKWRRWWEEHKQRHRIEWLIDGLTHKEAGLRHSAAEDLRTLTGENFGFRVDLSRKEREAVQARWRQWWQEAGRGRFTGDGDERLRPTAVLPSLGD